jgi:hypothetical protein
MLIVVMRRRRPIGSVRRPDRRIVQRRKGAHSTSPASTAAPTAARCALHRTQRRARDTLARALRD